VGLPLARVAGSRLFQHLINLFQGETFGFRHEKVGEEDY
jgi:hypothetical protein